MTRKSRGHVEFDSECPVAFESLVSETLAQSEFIDIEQMDDGLIIHEVGVDD